MKDAELYGLVRHAVQIDGLSQREAAGRFGINWRTVAKMMTYSVPPGYHLRKPALQSKLKNFVGMIERILDEDSRHLSGERHTSKSIFERLRDEYGFLGGITIEKDYVAGWHQRTPEVVVPLVCPPA